MDGQKDLVIASGRGIWGTIKNLEWSRAMQINIKRLESMGQDGKDAAGTLKEITKRGEDAREESQSD